MKAIRPTILCIDDNEDSLEILTIIFGHEGFDVKTCNYLENCIPLILQNDFRAIILDNWFESGTSLEICREIRSLKPNIPIIYYSAEARPIEIAKAIEAGANAYLTKPDGLDKLTETVNRLVPGSAFFL